MRGLLSTVKPKKIMAVLLAAIMTSTAGTIIVNAQKDSTDKIVSASELPLLDTNNAFHYQPYDLIESISAEGKESSYCIAIPRCFLQNLEISESMPDKESFMEKASDNRIHYILVRGEELGLYRYKLDIYGDGSLLVKKIVCSTDIKYKQKVDMENHNIKIYEYGSEKMIYDGNEYTTDFSFGEDKETNETYSIYEESVLPLAIEKSPSIYGDLNKDSNVDLTDLSLLSVNLMEREKFTEYQKGAADIDGSGEVDIADLAYFKQYISKDQDLSKTIKIDQY